MISKEACEKYAGICRYRYSRLMDISESALFQALEQVCHQAANYAEKSPEHEGRRLAEAEALLREARTGVENSAVQFGYPYTEYVDSIDAFLGRGKP